MDKKELIKQLNEIAERQKLIGERHIDTEDAHIVADSLLLSFIGDEEISKAFEDIKRWYA